MTLPIGDTYLQGERELLAEGVLGVEIGKEKERVKHAGGMRRGDSAEQTERVQQKESRQQSEREQIYNIAITKIPKIGHKNAKRLIAHFGSPEAVFKASRKELLSIFGISDGRISAIRGHSALDKAKAEVEYNAKAGIRSIYYNDPDYPARLREVEDGPIVIYVRGEADLNPERMISIVGTRKPNADGLQLCERFIEELQEFSPTIVSGLAFGIDAAAHQAAVKYGLPTLGVVAHGLADIYPARHRGLASKMVEQGGAILSEFSHNITAEREFFPMRNRIIAGLSDGLIVVQTAKKGGSMISADLANAYHREVFAFPGRVGDTTSQGCNLLIKNNRAQLIESAEDLAFQLGWDKVANEGKQCDELFKGLNEDESKIADVLKDGVLIGFDDLAFKVDLPQGQLSNILLELEFKGVVCSHPGKRYVIAQRNF